MSTGPARTPATEVEPLLRVEGLRISFGSGQGARRTSHEVLHGVDLSLRPGRVLALVGESGSGKSVLANAILGLLPRNAEVHGSVGFAGKQLLGAPAAELRAIRGGGIGSVFQEPMRAFNPLFSVGHQIAEAIGVHKPAERNPARVGQLLHSVGLPDVERIAGSLPHQLSGGQLQRAMIAMAISCHPSVLIADEPTTALDVTVQAEILDLLREISKAESVPELPGTAILLITHDMGVVADLADDVVVLREGSVVEQASVDQLFENPQHEYTKMLLASVPRLGSASGITRSVAGSPGRSVIRATPDFDSGTLMPALVEVTRLSVRFGGAKQEPALNQVSLAIAHGEVLGLVGESGSGKTTLGRVLAGLVPVDSGNVAFNGRRLNKTTLKTVRKELGIVFQDPASSLNPRHLIGSNIAEPLRLHSPLPRQAQSARVASLLESVQLPATMAERYPHELSGGQRQRAALARALALSPRLLIADEPTSALDVSVQARIIELFLELHEQFDFACLFISHDLAVVEQLANRVAVLRNGELIELGNTADVLSNPQDTYTRRLLAAAPVPDPAEQRRRRLAWAKVNS